MRSPVRASDRVARFSTETNSLPGMAVDSEVVGTVDAEARSISAAEKGTANSASSFNARQDRTTTAVRQTGRNPMGGFCSLRKQKPALSPPLSETQLEKDLKFVSGQLQCFSLLGWVQGTAVIQQVLQARGDSNHQGIHQHPPTDAHSPSEIARACLAWRRGRRPFSTWQSLLAMAA